jgi:hypothetical protein
MSDIEANLSALNLSIAARAYRIGLRVLDLGESAAVSSTPDHRVEIVRHETTAILRVIEQQMVYLGMEWRNIPVDRQIRTQVGLLQDSLYYAGPEALKGFGELTPAATDYLVSWRRSTMAMLGDLANAVERTQMAAETAATRLAVDGSPLADTLNKYQCLALNAFAQPFAADLMLAEAQGLAALPPGHPTVVSPYTDREMEQIFTVLGVLGPGLNMLISAFALDVSWRRTSAVLVHRLAYQAEECLSQVSDRVSRAGDARASAFASLSLRARQGLTLTLNLTCGQERRRRRWPRVSRQPRDQG